MNARTRTKLAAHIYAGGAARFDSITFDIASRFSPRYVCHLDRVVVASSITWPHRPHPIYSCAFHNHRFSCRKRVSRCALITFPSNDKSNIPSWYTHGNYSLRTKCIWTSSYFPSRFFFCSCEALSLKISPIDLRIFFALCVLSFGRWLDASQSIDRLDLHVFIYIDWFTCIFM